MWYLCQFDRTLLCLDVASPGHVLWEGHLTLLILRLTLGHITTGWGRVKGRRRGSTTDTLQQHTTHGALTLR